MASTKRTWLVAVGSGQEPLPERERAVCTVLAVARRRAADEAGEVGDFTLQLRRGLGVAHSGPPRFGHAPAFDQWTLTPGVSGGSAKAGQSGASLGGSSLNKP